MHDLIDAALQAAADAGAEYADARVVEAQHEAIEVPMGGSARWSEARAQGSACESSWTAPGASRRERALRRSRCANRPGGGRHRARERAGGAGAPVQLSPLEPQRGTWNGSV